MPIEIIDGDPVRHQHAAAELIWTTDIKLTNYLLRGRSNWNRMAATDWPNETGLLTYKRSRLALEGGQIVGITVTHDLATLDEHFETSLQRWKKVCDPSLATHLEEAFELLGRLYPHPSPSSHYLLEIAVASEHRGRGIGHTLLMDAVAEALRLGRRSLCLDVDANAAAVGFYRRCGLDIDVETTSTHSSEAAWGWNAPPHVLIALTPCKLLLQEFYREK